MIRIDFKWFFFKWFSIDLWNIGSNNMTVCHKAFFIINFLYKNLILCTKMSKELSAKYYQNKERIKKSLWKVSRSFWRRQKQKASLWLQTI